MGYTSTASLKDRVAIVTGAAGGIGFEASKALQDHGATVVISDINADGGEIVGRELGVEFFRADVTRSEEVHSLAQHVQQRYGRIDVAFNNAGIAHSVPSEECTDEVWLKVININLTAAFYCCREFGKVMLAQGRGSLINTASMDWNPTLNTPEWKNALSAYVDLATNYGPPGVTSNGFNENLTIFSTGKAAMWIDATVAGGSWRTPRNPRWSAKLGTRLRRWPSRPKAPTGSGPGRLPFRRPPRTLMGPGGLQSGRLRKITSTSSPRISAGRPSRQAPANQPTKILREG